MLHARKVVLISNSGYSAQRDNPLLMDLINSKIALFCTVGVDCEKWEDALDWLCINEDGKGEHFIVTTSHPGELVDEVMDFAKAFFTENENEIEVLRV